MNKELLKKGIKKMFFFIFCSFSGPILFFQALKNKEHLFYYPVLSFGLIIMIIAIYYGFSGIKTILLALLGKKKIGLFNGLVCLIKTCYLYKDFYQI